MIVVIKSTVQALAVGRAGADEVEFCVRAAHAGYTMGSWETR